MAVRIVNLTKTSTWQWDKDPDFGTDEATTFTFRPLDGYEQAYLNDRLTSMEGTPSGNTEAEIAESMANQSVRTEMFKVALEAFRLALVDVTNLLDEDGNTIEFKTEKANIGGKTKLVASADIVKAVPAMLAMGAYKHIMELSTVSKSAEKNSAQA